MTKQLKIFWLGMLIYFTSFFLVGVQLSSPLVGFGCAFTAFVYPWVQANDVLLHGVRPQFGPLAWFCLLVSGWINPVFLLTAILDLVQSHQQLVVRLKVLIVLMVPFCWFFFLSGHFRAREGHYAWVFGMLLVLFSRKVGGWLGFKDLESIDMEVAKNNSLQQFPSQ